MTADRPDQFVVVPDRPAATELSALVALANRQRLQDREARARVIRQALNDARRR